MRFHSYQIEVDGRDNFNKADMQDTLHKGKTKFQDGGMLYLIQLEILEDRFLWISCDYDNVKKFSRIVVNQNTLETQPNPRTKEQVEPRQQLFALYDTIQKVLYISDINRRPFVRDYLQDVLQKDIEIKAIYRTVDDFCNAIKTIKELYFKQTNNLISRQSDIYTVATNMSGLDVDELQVKIGLGNVPVNAAHPLLSRLQRKRDEFESIVVVGVDDNDIEQTFDYSSVLKHIEVHVVKDENEHYDSDEVKIELLKELRNSGNV